MMREVINFGSYLARVDVLLDGRADDLPVRFGLGLESIVATADGLRLPRLRRHRHGRDSGAVLLRLRDDVQQLRQARVPRTYDAILAAPVDVDELVTAEVLWVACRAGVFGCAPLIVAFFFGLSPEPTVVLVPLVAFLTGFGFAALGR